MYRHASFAARWWLNGGLILWLRHAGVACGVKPARKELPSSSAPAVLWLLQVPGKSASTAKMLSLL